MISDVIPDIIPPDLQHVLWVDKYPLRNIDRLIARRVNANKVTDIKILQPAFEKWGAKFLDSPPRSTKETELRYVLLRVLEYNDILPKLVSEEWDSLHPPIRLNKKRCSCSHHNIINHCFITHIPTKLEFLVGVCCIKRVPEFDKLTEYNERLINDLIKNEQAEKKAEDQRKLIEEAANKAAKKIEDEAEEQRIAIQKIDDILKCCPRDTFANSVKQQVIAGSKVSSKQMVVIEEIYVKKKVKATLDLW